MARLSQKMLPDLLSWTGVLIDTQRCFCGSLGLAKQKESVGWEEPEANSVEKRENHYRAGETL